MDKIKKFRSSKLISECVITKNNEETEKLGEEFGRVFRGVKVVVSMTGDLGSGKTTFVKGVAKGLGITKTIKSPTFVMLKHYKYDMGILVHVDAYRLGDDFEDIGLVDYFGSALVMIEWAENIEGVLPEERVEIFFEHIDNNKRKICFEKKY